MNKRKYNDRNNESNNLSKRRKNNMNDPLIWRQGLGKGILLTCERPSNLMDACTELINILDEWNTECFDEEEEIAILDFDKQLENEMNQLKNKDEKLFTWHKLERTRSLGFIKFYKDEYDPVQFVKWLFDKVKNEKIALTRYIVRLIPFQHIIYMNIDEFFELVTPKINKVFGGIDEIDNNDIEKMENENDDINLNDTKDNVNNINEENIDDEVKKIINEEDDNNNNNNNNNNDNDNNILTTTWKIWLKRRNNNSFPKDEVKKRIAKIIYGFDLGHQVDLNNAKTIIIIEAIFSNIGFSIIENFQDYGDLNISKWQNIYVEK